MAQYSSSLSFHSDIKNLALVEEAIDKLVDDQLISDVVYGNVIVAVTEGTLNAINHGNQGDATKTTQISIEIDNDELTVIIDDEGPGFDHENLPDPTDPENLEKVNGRGIFIIKNLSDEVEFEREGARLKMSFKLNVKELVEA